jgi:hypothetical protein
LAELANPRFLRPLAAPGADIGHAMTFGPDQPLKLDSGRVLAPFTVAYMTYGALNAEKSTATLAEKFGWPLKRINRAGQHLWANALWCEPLSVRASRDPDDDHILGCALAAEAAVIVTGDKDLLALHPFRNTAIVTPARFLDLQVEATVLMKETRT